MRRTTCGSVTARKIEGGDRRFILEEELDEKNNKEHKNWNKKIIRKTRQRGKNKQKPILHNFVITRKNNQKITDQ